MTETDNWASGYATIVHFGWVPTNGGAVKPALETAIERIDRGVLPGFVTDRDSFTTWGEALDAEALGFGDDALHLVMRDHGTWHPHDRWRVQSLVKHIERKLGGHVVDYAVATDAADWSEDVVVIGCFA